MEKSKARKMMPQCPAMAMCPPQFSPMQIAPEQFMSQPYTPQPCIPQEEVIDNVRLAAAYVPWQCMCNIFCPVEALMRGTVFPELFSPYDGRDKMMCCEKETILRRNSYEG